MAISDSNPEYTLCTRCHKTKTKSPSGLCSRCAKMNPVDSRTCAICGAKKTKDPSGVCATCRRVRKNVMLENPVIEATRLDEAILIATKNLRLLTMRKNGASFAVIGREIGMTKSSTYALYTRLIGSPMLNVIDKDDGYLDVSSFRAQSTLAPPRLRNENDVDEE